MSIPLRCRVQYTAEEHWDGQKLFLRTKTKSAWRMLGWLIPAAGFALTLFAWSQGWRIWIFIFALSVFLIFEPTLLRRRMLHKQFRNQPHLHAPLDVTINAEGISSQSSFNTGSSRWEMLGPWAEDEKTVLILVKGANIFYTFPKRQLSREQIGNLRELLKNHIKP